MLLDLMHVQWQLKSYNRLCASVMCDVWKQWKLLVKRAQHCALWAGGTGSVLCGLLCAAGL